MTRGTLSVLARLAASLIWFAVMEGAIFHTGLYSSVIEPNSTTGMVEQMLANELRRQHNGRNQILAVGHSRMGLLPRVANTMTSQTGYTFASVAIGGTGPRCWFYELRAVDPAANRYAAVVIPVDDYDEPDTQENLAERREDLHYLIVRLGLADVAEFSGSYESPMLRLQAALGILFKGYVLREDFQNFLVHHKSRMKRIEINREKSASWIYDFGGDSHSLAGLSVDWEKNVIEFPADLPQEKRDLVRTVLFKDWPSPNGLATAYYAHWYGRILDHYKGSGTRIIFVRVPRGPVIPPQSQPSKPDSAVRRMASRRGVTIVDEHRFDELERPELFGDPLHMNAQGMTKFSRLLAVEVSQILGSAKP